MSFARVFKEKIEFVSEDLYYSGFLEENFGLTIEENEDLIPVELNGKFYIIINEEDFNKMKLRDLVELQDAIPDDIY